MTEILQPSNVSSANRETKKAYHTPALREFGTVKELTLTGGIDGVPDNIQTPDYATGGGTY